MAACAFLWYAIPTLVVRGIAVLGTLFFGFCGLYALAKVFDRRPGLVLDHEGIIDNSSALPAGRIRWDEITGIRMSDVQSQIFLTIDVVDARRFVERGGALRRFANRANMGLVGSAINISTNGLAISRVELARQLAAFFEAYGPRGS